MTEQNVLTIRGLSKRFQAVQALSDVDLNVVGGKVHALLGENGSGKSTLIKVLAGYHDADAGTVRIADAVLPLPITAPLAHGIAVIHQDLGLVGGMSVLDNLGVNMSYGTRLLLPVPVSRQRQIYSKLLRDLQLNIDLDRTVESLSPAERALVAIVRAVRALETGASRLFILDEPTAYLPQSEARRLTGLMRAIATRGTGVLFVSHRLEEVMATSDYVTVLRDGRVVASGKTSDLSREAIVSAMLGDKAATAMQRAASTAPRHRQRSDQEPAIAVDHLSGPGIEDISFSAERGEVLGITGLTGMGQDELARLIAGAVPRIAGQIRIDGESVGNSSPRALTRAGAVFVPNDRPRLGLWMDGSAAENITLPILKRFFARGLLRGNAELDHAQLLMTRYSVRPSSPTRPAWTFSGGNQQKILLAKWLQFQPKVILISEPTQGVDVAARSEILGVLKGMAAQGVSVTIFASDHEFLALACNRVLVMRQGRITDELVDDDVVEENLVLAAQGTTPRLRGTPER